MRIKTWLCLISVLAISSLAAAGPFDTWTRKTKISFSGYSKQETLTNFPALVVFSNGMASGFSYGDFLSLTNGDLRFADSNETTALNYEIESWNTNGSSYVWVQVPTLSSTNASIYAYWGRSGTNAAPCTTNGATWTNGYVGVWHLKESSNGAYYDSTSNRITSTAGTATQAAGEAGYGQTFNGTSDYINFSSAALNNPSITVEFWINPSAPGNAITALFDYDHASTGMQGWVVQCEDATSACNYYWVYYDGATFQPSGNFGSGKGVQISNGQWQHIAYTKAGTTVTGYRNGASAWAPPAATSANVYYAGGRTVRLGNTVSVQTPQRWAKGTFDEVRVSSAARSLNWVWATYMNMASNATFSHYGTVLYANTPQVDNASGATNIALASAWLNGTLITNGISDTAVFVFWGQANAGTNGGPVQWANTNTWPAPQLPGIFTTNVTGLSSNATYYYRFAASNTAGMAWANTSPFFMTGPINVDVTANASEIGLTPGLFTIRRPNTATNEAVTVNYTISGSATAGVNYVNNLGSSITIPAGASNVTLTVTPMNNWGNQSDTTIILTPAIGQYPDSSANAATLTISNRPLPTVTGSGTIHYVSPYGTAVSPYTSWATAATDPAAAVGVAANNDTVAILTGTYTLSSEIPLTTAITVMSADGAGYTNTILNGNGVGRIFNVSANVVIDGLTISNGYAATLGGGGVKMSAGTVRNCLICNNNAVYPGGGGGVQLAGGFLANCQILNNFGATDNDDGGGGVRVTGGIASNCFISGNSSQRAGGGAAVMGGLLEDSLVTSNQTTGSGTGIYTGGGGTARRCIVTGNIGTASAIGQYGGFVDECVVTNNPGDGIGYRGATVRNCLVARNGGNGVSCSWGGAVENCTVANNGGAGVVLNGSGGATLVNNIFYSNTGGNYGGGDMGNTYWYNNCSYPTISGGAALSGNITNNPLFVSASDYHLQKGSPAIDAGMDLTTWGITTDITGITPRPTRNGYDIGCYEELNAPRVMNLAAIVTSSSAVLGGKLVYDGATNTYVTIYWGTTDGGTNTSAWANTNFIGQEVTGALYSNTVVLASSTTYYFRNFASNNVTTVWADASQSFLTYAGSSQDRVWTGNGGNALASNTNNWQGQIAPQTGDGVVLDLSSSNMTWDAAAPTNLARWFQNTVYGGTVTFNTVFGTSGFTNLNIAGDASLYGGTWTHPLNGGAETYRLRITVGGNLLITNTAMISANAVGWNGGSGPGGGANWAGGAYGGDGGNGNPNIYGSFYTPTNIGSGGFNGGKGGGAIWLTVGATTTVSSTGIITANGENNNNGSGAGGSVYLTTGWLAGAGTIRANGGYQGNGDGSGGRIALILTGVGADFTNWTGANTAYGGAVANYGAAGTVYRKTTTGVDSLIVDNNGATSRDATMTRMPNNINLNSISNVVLNHKGVLGVIGNTTLDFSTFNPTTNGSAQSYLAIISDTNVTYGANWTIAGYTVRGEGISKTLTNVTIGNAGALSHRENGGTGTEPYKLNLTLVGNLTVLSNGAISAYAKGYSVQQGPGGCSANSWKGGAYGGGGGNANMNTYGSLLSPTNIGSGGNGGYGGGAILMNVIGTTTVATGGTIAANGENNGNGSGSGGTVNLTTGWLAGGGRIGADGGAGSGNGDGGGGRVAIVLTGAGANYSTWTGTNTAYGGASASYGAAGTVYQGTPGGAAGAGAVIVDNRNVATNVVFASLPAFAASNENLKKTSWTVQNKGKIGMTTNSFISSLTLNATSYLELSGQTLTLNALTITNKVYIAGTYTAAQLGGVLVTDGVGGGKIVLLTRGTAAFFR